MFKDIKENIDIIIEDMGNLCRESETVKEKHAGERAEKQSFRNGGGRCPGESRIGSPVPRRLV